MGMGVGRDVLVMIVVLMTMRSVMMGAAVVMC